MEKLQKVLALELSCVCKHIKHIGPGTFYSPAPVIFEQSCVCKHIGPGTFYIGPGTF
jgi:hypothetical protein